MNRRNFIGMACLCGLSLGLWGCGQQTGSTSGTAASSAASDTSAAKDSGSTAAGSSADAATASLSGHTLNIYCGAGMTDAFTDIAALFKETTGCEMLVTYAHAGAIQTQIKTTESGDYFIAGSRTQLEPVSDYVDTATDLVKHTPVLAVPSDNPKEVSSLADLTKVDSLIIGDTDATAIGKVAKQALTKAGLWEELESKITTAAAAPPIAVALAAHEGDAGITWKENALIDGVSVVDTTDMEPYIRTIPSARLTCAADAEACDAFDSFLMSAEVYEIWTKYGYESI